jgi:hypothetical protein
MWFTNLSEMQTHCLANTKQESELHATTSNHMQRVQQSLFLNVINSTKNIRVYFSVD